MTLEELFDDTENLTYTSITEELEKNNIFVKFVENKDGMVKAYRTNGKKQQSDYQLTKRKAILVLLVDVMGEKMGRESQE